MSKFDKNTVDAKNQIDKDELVSFYGNKNGCFKVLFVGNSITRHGVKEDIGWHLDCGMAASAAENDYVHLVMKEVLNKHCDAGFCICQAADWERNYKNGEKTLVYYEAAKKFEPDLMILRLIENCPKEDFDPKFFKKEYEILIDYLAKKDTQIILTTGFWKHPGDLQIEELAKERKICCTYLGNYGEADNMKALGLFKHEGVAAHPGDLGMRKIAEEILKLIRF